MADEIQSDAAAGTVCTWCSAPLSSPDLERCPSCGAHLVGDVAEPLPGVTAVDAAALVRGMPTSTRPRNRWLSWISGDYPDDVPTAKDAKALEPPDIAVRREMLRLELEGEVANLKAEADALVAEAAAEGRVVEAPDISALSEGGVAAAEAALIGDDEATHSLAAVASEAAPDGEAAPAHLEVAGADVEGAEVEGAEVVPSADATAADAAVEGVAAEDATAADTSAADDTNPQAVPPA